MENLLTWTFQVAEAVVNQRLHRLQRGDVESDYAASIIFGCVVFCSIANTTNPAEGVREPAHQEFNLGSAVDAIAIDQLRSTSLACGVMSG